MIELLDAIRAAVADDATPENKAAGAQACRTLLAALEVEPGKTLALPTAPARNPLAGISADQAIDLVIAKLRSMVPQAGDERASRGVRIALVPPPPRRSRRSP